MSHCMKNLLLSATFIFTTLQAQIPSGYYNTATGAGYTLKTQLYNIIKNHNNQGYSNLYNCYANSDVDIFYENDNSILDIYSENPSGVDAYNYPTNNQRCGNYSGEGDCYNREHLIPQSVFASANPMYADAHFIVPTDGYVNGKRSNFPFGVVNTASWTSTNGSKLGLNKNSGYSRGYSQTVFEPIDAFKGDIARQYFYFATRYENLVNTWNFAMFNNTQNEVLAPTFKNILLQWHHQDPVSNREIARNNAVYNYQNNRNPYIDHPEYVDAIWQEACISSNYDYSTTICQGQTYLFNNINISTGGVYNKTLTNSVGCDSIVSVNLFVTPITTPLITANGNVLSSSLNSGNQWYFNNNIIQSATNQNYTVSNTGSYTVKGTGNCQGTSAPFTVSTVNIETLNTPFNIYPNPADNVINISSQDNFNVQIYNTIGQLVFNDFNTNIILTENYSNGIYYLELESKKKIHRYKIIIQH